MTIVDAFQLKDRFVSVRHLTRRMTWSARKQCWVVEYVRTETVIIETKSEDVAVATLLDQP